MSKLLNNYSLKHLNSFGIDIKARLFSNFNSDSCPIELDPLSIILDMRRYLVMEKSRSKWRGTNNPIRHNKL